MKTVKIAVLINLLLAFSFHVSAYTERDLLQKAADRSKVGASLLPERQWFPYPSYRDRQGWDNLLGEWKSEFIRRGEKQADYEWSVVKATDYIEFERSGNRRIMEDPFGRNNNAISDLLMAELAEGKGRFVDQLINGVFLSCEMTSWALSAHLNAQHSHRSLPESTEHVIDLTAGDLGSLLSYCYYFLRDEFDKVNPEVSRRLRAELQSRILDTYMKEDRFWWMAFHYEPGVMVNNWNPWCNFNMLQCFLLLEDDPEVRADAVYRTMVSVDKFINYTHSDGACEEGPSYWGHAAGKMYDYLQLLHDATGGRVSVFNEPVVRNMGEYISRSYVGNGWVVNFADASARGGGDAPLIYRYGKAVGSDEMIHYAAYLAKSGNRSAAPSPGRDVFRTLQTCLFRDEMERVEPKHQTPDYTWYPETEFCYMKNKNGLFFAAKGGYNNESHNHNDAGTFSLYVNTIPVIIDAGVGTYTRQTFSNERYNIWTMQSNYHNLPLINGTAQSFGNEYKATDVSFNKAGMTFSLNIAAAYPQSAGVKRWIRSYTLKNGTLKISDNFDLTKTDSPNRIHFLTWGNVNTDTPGVVEIEAKGEKVRLVYDKNLFTVLKEIIRLDDQRLSNVWGDVVCRLSLQAKTATLKGKYTYTILKE
ncbi:MAG: heparinase II/III-family protein [Tannerella sp.]|jgi:hypothetical protein|nr:heparinase II/III-family protein [Tannerella sp.]